MITMSMTLVSRNPRATISLSSGQGVKQIRYGASTCATAVSRSGKSRI